MPLFPTRLLHSHNKRYHNHRDYYKNPSPIWNRDNGGPTIDRSKWLKIEMIVLPDVASRERRRHGAAKVLHHGVGIVVGGLVFEGLEMVQPEQLGLAGRVELTVVGNV